LKQIILLQLDTDIPAMARPFPTQSETGQEVLTEQSQILAHTFDLLPIMGNILHNVTTSQLLNPCPHPHPHLPRGPVSSLGVFFMWLSNPGTTIHCFLPTLQSHMNGEPRSSCYMTLLGEGLGHSFVGSRVSLQLLCAVLSSQVLENERQEDHFNKIVQNNCNSSKLSIFMEGNLIKSLHLDKPIENCPYF